MVKGSRNIDPAKVAFIGTITPRGVGGNPMPDYQNPITEQGKILGYGKVVVPKQGIWTIESSLQTPPQQQIVFSPDRGVAGTPTAVTYAVADTNGLWSKPAPIVLYEDVDKLLAAAAKLRGKDDDTFWRDFETNIVSQTTDLDELIVAVNALRAMTIAALGRSASVTLLSAEAGHQITGPALNALYLEWLQDGATVQSLYNITKREITDAKTGLSATPLATRLLRLVFMQRIFRRFTAAMIKTTNQGNPN